MKLWQGRFHKQLDEAADAYNSSIPFDQRMYREDITGSMAHAAMLGAQDIISEEDANLIIDTLGEILEDIEEGRLEIDLSAEDIHTFVEGELTSRIGNAGKRLHTARSRNDQVALDIRLYLRKSCDDIVNKLGNLMIVLCDMADKYCNAVMPGYTHLQRAQPITFGHWLMAYASMIKRDIGRIEDARGRMNISPLGCCALAGTTYPIDRKMTARELGFDGCCINSLDGVSDRDFCVEIASALSLLMVHLSRFSEEIILFSSWEFKFIELSDSFSTGSSIMPQKKNPDIAELTRGKSGRVIGDLVTLLTVMKGLPLAYNKDMQEDKEAIFDAVDTVTMCLDAFTPMIATMTPLTENMRKAAAGGFINATDCADYLTNKGMPFRDAYKITGELVARCIDLGHTLETLPLEEYRKMSNLFTEDIYKMINLDRCVSERRSEGGPCPDNVMDAATSMRYHAHLCIKEENNREN